MAVTSRARPKLYPKAKATKASRAFRGFSGVRVTLGLGPAAEGGSLWPANPSPARLALAEQRSGQLRQFHCRQFDGRLLGVACLSAAGDGRDEQRALRWKAARKVQELKLASLVHGASQQELESLLDFGRLGVPVLRPYRTKCEEGGKGLEFGGKIGDCGFHVTLG